MNSLRCKERGKGRRGGGGHGNEDTDLRLECLGSGAGGNVSLRHQVTFTVRRSVEVLLLSPKKEEVAKAARHFS